MGLDHLGGDSIPSNKRWFKRFWWIW
jgi:hypothetical protein